MKRTALAPALAALALTTVAACRDAGRGDQRPAAGPQHQLRTYHAPTGHEKQAERLLREVSYPVQVVTAEGAQTQFVRLSPQLTHDGYFVLSAPPGIHDGVRQLLDQLAGTAPAPEPRTIETTCWIVLGWPSAEAQVAPQLGEAADTLAALGGLGPMRFELLDRVQVAALDGEEATASGNAVQRLETTASIDGDAVSIRIEIGISGGTERTGIDTTVSIPAGKLAVLGQAGFVPAAAGHGDRATLLYLVRARTIP